VPTNGHDTRLLTAPTGVTADLLRSFRIWSEFVRGFVALRRLGPCVTVFGSARFTEDHRYYQLAREVGRAFGRAGFAVMTGGGPGVMEAANRGARDVGALSVGCNIQLEREQEPNDYLDWSVDFRYFFVRKVMLVKYSCAFVLMPGGYGTMDEIFETATLIQTEKIRQFPVVVLGQEYWSKLRPFLRETMLEHGTIDESDLDHTFATDDAAEAVAHVSGVVRNAGITLVPIPEETEE